MAQGAQRSTAPPRCCCDRWSRRNRMVVTTSGKIVVNHCSNAPESQRSTDALRGSSDVAGHSNPTVSRDVTLLLLEDKATLDHDIWQPVGSVCLDSAKLMQRWARIINPRHD